MELGGILAKILKSVDRSRAILNLVENEQGGTRVDGLAQGEGEVGHNAIGIERLFKERSELARCSRIDVLQREVGDVLVAPPAEFLEHLGLPHLARSLDDERLAERGLFPSHEASEQVTFQIERLANHHILLNFPKCDINHIIPRNFVHHITFLEVFER